MHSGLDAAAERYRFPACIEGLGDKDNRDLLGGRGRKLNGYGAAAGNARSPEEERKK